jgi:alpha-tubulin suppressor-like RCC1 family protein
VTESQVVAISATPNKINTQSGWVQVALGHQHTVALQEDGGLYSWGLGICGQLGHSQDKIREADSKAAKLLHPVSEGTKYTSEWTYREPPQHLITDPDASDKAH